LNSRHVTKDGGPPLFDRNKGDLSTQENKARPQSPIPKENQPKNEVHRQSLSPKRVVSSHAQDPTPQRDGKTDSPQ